MKLIAWALMAAAMTSAAGCATVDFCNVASPIRPSVTDVLSDGTGTQILKHNRYGEQACGWKP